MTTCLILGIILSGGESQRVKDQLLDCHDLQALQEKPNLVFSMNEYRFLYLYIQMVYAFTLHCSYSYSIFISSSIMFNFGVLWPLLSRSWGKKTKQTPLGDSSLIHLKIACDRLWSALFLLDGLDVRTVSSLKVASFILWSLAPCEIYYMVCTALKWLIPIKTRGCFTSNFISL